MSDPLTLDAETPDISGMHRAIRLSAAPLLAVTLASSTRGQVDGGAADIEPVQLPNRVMQTFGFEEGAILPERYPFPTPFFRVTDETASPISPRGGFPLFGDIRLTNEDSTEGDWSVRFDLNGGSMAIRVPSAVVPILPGGDYTVAASVRTEGLRHARARLVAWFHDRDGAIIEDSITFGPPLNTDGEWRRTYARLIGEHPGAVDLALELQVVQPDHLPTDPDRLGAPEFDDVSGRIWFDEVTIIQLPRVDLRPTAPGGVFVGDTPTVLKLHIRDVRKDIEGARIVVFDEHSELIFDEIFPAPNIGVDVELPLPDLGFGWRRAVVELIAGGDVISRTPADFVVAPETPALGRRHDPRWGVLLPDRTIAELRHGAPLVRDLKVGAVITPVWSEAIGRGQTPERLDELTELLDAFQPERTETGALLGAMSPETAADLAAESNDVLALFADDTGRWSEELEQLLFRFGQFVRRWTLGRPTHHAAAPEPDHLDALARAVAIIGETAPGPVVSAAWPSDVALPVAPIGAQFIITLSTHGGPDHAAALRDAWSTNEDERTVLLQTLPEDPYGVVGAAVDLARRSLELWRDDRSRLMIDAPWRLVDPRRDRVEPTPLYAVWRQLAAKLGRRSFLAEIEFGPGIEAWLANGDHGPVLIAWANGERGDVMLDADLGADPITVHDIWGGRTPAVQSDRRCLVPLSESPVFLEGVDRGLAAFRALARLEPAFLPAEHRVHRAEIVLENPWDLAVSGSIAIPPPGDDWSIVPRQADFVIDAEGAVRIPLEIIFPRTVTAGRHDLQAVIDVQGDQTYAFSHPLPLEIGLPELDVSVTWSLAGRGGRDARVIVTAVLANRGDDTLHLDAHLAGAGIARQRKAVPALPPGDSTVRTFLLPATLLELQGKTLRLTVSEREGARAISRPVDIPALPDPSGAAEQVAGAADDSDDRP